jgi:hypothetical protein
VLPISYLFQLFINNTKEGKMTNKKTEAGGAENTAAVGGTRKIHWDDSNMRSVYSNVCNVAGTREEVVLLFGMNQAWHSGQAEVTIQLADRIVLSPFVAKRLSMLLNNVMQDYESKYGNLKID